MTELTKAKMLALKTNYGWFGLTEQMALFLLGKEFINEGYTREYFIPIHDNRNKLKRFIEINNIKEINGSKWEGKI